MREAQTATTKKLGGLEVGKVESPKRFQQLLVTKSFSTQRLCQKWLLDSTWDSCCNLAQEVHYNL